MSELQTRRPKRLWVAALMNIAVGLMAMVFVVFFSLSSRVPDEARLGTGSIVFAVITTSLLIVSSVLALFGKRRWDRIMLSAALVYYGSVLAQNASLLVQSEELIIPVQKVVANVARSGIEIAINLWAILSAKTRFFFRHASASPQ